MAAEYARVFGERPSSTLARDPAVPRMRLADALSSELHDVHSSDFERASRIAPDAAPLT
jgi:hypothetical protein